MQGEWNGISWGGSDVCDDEDNDRENDDDRNIRYNGKDGDGGL